MELALNRPIVFFDLETTGVNVASDRIVEYSFLKVAPDGTRTTMSGRLNPTIPIPAVVTAIHGISDADVVDCPTFAEKAKEINLFLQNCDLGGYNSNKFDVPLLVEEFIRADIEFSLVDRKTIDVQNIFHKMEQRTLAAAYKFYCGKDLEHAHSAEADNLATFDVLEAQLAKYQSLEKNVSFLHKFSTVNRNVDFAGRIVLNEKDEEVFNFGKHKGKTVFQVLKEEPGYYSWMMNGDFPAYTKRVLTAIRLKMFNKV